jgi:tetratricopeptide (TPR) repeat protein
VRRFDENLKNRQHVLLSADVWPLPDEKGLYCAGLVAIRSDDGELVVEAGEFPEPPSDLLSWEHAQLLAYEAYEKMWYEYDWDPRMESEVRSTAARALESDPDCIDALIAISMTYRRGSKQSLQFAKQAHAIAARVLKEIDYEVEGGDLWRAVGVRGAVRAHAHLAKVLWRHGEREEACRVSERALEANPPDNVGTRWHLPLWYLTLGEQAAARQVLQRQHVYPTAPLAWGYALIVFAGSGEGDKAKTALRHATRANPLILGVLRGATEDTVAEAHGYVYRKRFFMSGTPDEVIRFASPILEAWVGTPGALDWVEKCAREKQFARMVTEAESFYGITLPDPAQTTGRMLAIADATFSPAMPRGPMQCIM